MRVRTVVWRHSIAWRFSKETGFVTLTVDGIVVWSGLPHQVPDVDFKWVAS